MSKLGILGWTILTIGAIGTLAAVIMELIVYEPIYYVIMKATALLFGVGGALIGIGEKRKT